LTRDEGTNSRYAAVRAHVVRDEKVLLGLSVKRKHVWTTFGGKPEGRESVEEALRRELREELGVEVIAFQRLPDRNRSWDGRRSQVAVFTVTKWKGEPRNCEPHEHEAIAWFTREELQSLAMAEIARSEALEVLA
jgi:8-oxo-dGTP diphosphatase